MEEIKCPKCGQVIKVDDSDYIQILEQVRNKQFQKELDEYKSNLEDKKNNEIDLKISKIENEHNQMMNLKDREISELKNTLMNADLQKKIAIDDAMKAKEQEIQNLKDEKTKAESEIDRMKLKHKEEMIDSESGYKLQIETMEKEVAFYKDFKAKQSTKMIGESLERYCHEEFEKLRATAFQNAYFEKDNDASGGTKGDFVFKDYVDGIECTSIMFEMKNEADETATKKTNEHFLEKLDKDRKAKDCEYAVLVSMLEPDNESYNVGIVDVSHRYPKMYVVRPQFFIPIISLIRNASRESYEYKRSLAEYQKQNMDITKFESNLEEFKTKFQKNFESATNSFEKAIEEIDKTIDHLTKVKDSLLSSGRQLRYANDKAQDISIKKLTRGNETMKRKFEELNMDKGNE